MLQDYTLMEIRQMEARQMALKTRTTEELMQIAAAGGGFRFNSGTRHTDDLTRIAAAAKSGDATVVLAGISDRPTADLIQIAAAGKGSVIFED